MRTVKIGDRDIKLTASPIALLFYKQEFGGDLIADMGSFTNLQADIEDGYLGGFDSLALLQMAWAMNKSSQPLGNHFPKFEEWIGEFDHIDYANEEWAMAVIDEIQDGFFRSASTNTKNAGGKSKPSKK